ncbi:MAG: hypothetical protein BWY02_02581 [bacterium ADurb.Bin157]|nr:MAG: hypothetical protein BWY02_02581 [bacterium ADurb.Bin157]
MARVQVINEAEHDFDDPKGWKLLFQWCLYVYDDGRSEKGYRFIWRRPESEGATLQAARGQARIPSIEIANLLIEKAKKDGWGNLKG